LLAAAVGKNGVEVVAGGVVVVVAGGDVPDDEAVVGQPAVPVPAVGDAAVGVEVDRYPVGPLRGARLVHLVVGADVGAKRLAGVHGPRRAVHRGRRVEAAALDAEVRAGPVEAGGAEERADAVLQGLDGALQVLEGGRERAARGGGGGVLRAVG